MNSQLFYQCQVLSVDDPLMLGRIRARRLIDNYQDELQNSISDPPWNEQTDQWTERDPFVFLPLLPYYVYQTPKVDEMVLSMYLTPDVKYSNKFYIQSTFYSPTSTNFQFYQGGNKFLGTGLQIQTPRPLKNSDGTYTNQQRHKGVFPEPGDNSILGRGSADLIVKQDEVLVRAGKFQGDTLKPNVIPVANTERAFLQLSRFDTFKRVLPNRTLKYITELSVSVKYLIEYKIINPENQFDIFSGYVFLFQLKPSVETSSFNLTVGSVIPEDKKILVATESFTNLSSEGVVEFINNFISDCNEKNISDDGTQLFTTNDKYPIFYRPNTEDYNLMTNTQTNFPKANPNVQCIGNVTVQGGECFLELKLFVTETSEDIYVAQQQGLCSNSGFMYVDLVSTIMNVLDELNLGYVPIPTFQEMEDNILPATPEYSSVTMPIIQENLSFVFNKIRLNTSAAVNGYGLIWKKDTVGTPTKLESKEIPQTETVKTYSTYGAIGSDYIYLLSHQSAIPGKAKINFDDTLYGISQEKFFNDITPNTSSTVRGEELLEILQVIYEFLVSHTHPFPGLAPNDKGLSGVTKERLKSLVNNAGSTILNKYIRVN